MRAASGGKSRPARGPRRRRDRSFPRSGPGGLGVGTRRRRRRGRRLVEAHEEHDDAGGGGGQEQQGRHQRGAGPRRGAHPGPIMSKFAALVVALGWAGEPARGLGQGSGTRPK